MSEIPTYIPKDIEYTLTPPYQSTELLKGKDNKLININVDENTHKILTNLSRLILEHNVSIHTKNTIKTIYLNITFSSKIMSIEKLNEISPIVKKQRNNKGIYSSFLKTIGSQTKIQEKQS